MNTAIATRLAFASVLVLAATACKDKAASNPAATKPTAGSAETTTGSGATAAGSAAPAPGSADVKPTADTAGSAAVTTSPKECWGTYKVGDRTLTFANDNAAEPPAEPGDMEKITEELKATADGGCEIVAHFDVSGGHSDDPVTELYKITVKPDGSFTGTKTVQGDLDPTTEDKPTVTQLSGKRNAAK
ncbi:MAG TPA: hypothetical protein VM513_14220 [Kofleriaceae bacterium]|nr:hypothetical protein [Kofleriaceae bacterium]